MTTDRELLIRVTAHLAAAVSLIEAGGKKAAPSDRAFRQMLKDHKACVTAVDRHCKAPKSAGPWHVVTKRDTDDDGNPAEHEVSVVHRQFRLGHDSMGWDGPNKLIVDSAESESCPEGFADAKTRAQIIADAFNAARIPFTKE